VIITTYRMMKKKLRPEHTLSDQHSHFTEEEMETLKTNASMGVTETVTGQSWGQCCLVLLLHSKNDFASVLRAHS
jgi:hypothetical protein